MRKFLSWTSMLAGSFLWLATPFLGPFALLTMPVAWFLLGAGIVSLLTHDPKPEPPSETSYWDVIKSVFKGVGAVLAAPVAGLYYGGKLAFEGGKKLFDKITGKAKNEDGEGRSPPGKAGSLEQSDDSENFVKSLTGEQKAGLQAMVLEVVKQHKENKNEKEITEYVTKQIAALNLSEAQTTQLTNIMNTEQGFKNLGVALFPPTQARQPNQSLLSSGYTQNSNTITTQGREKPGGGRANNTPPHYG